MPTGKTERVSMNWPAGLKDEVRNKVGTRGITDFAIAAVQVRLLDGDPLGEARSLAQTFVEMLQNNGHPVNGQMPDWLMLKAGSATSTPTIVGPDEREVVEPEVQSTMAERVPTKPVVPGLVEEPVVTVPVEQSVPRNAPIPASADGSWSGPRGSSTATLEDLQNKAKGLGIDLGPASAIVRDSGPDYEVSMVDDVPVATTPPHMPKVLNGRPVQTVPLPDDLCLTCQEPLVNGECWNCDL